MTRSSNRSTIPAALGAAALLALAGCTPAATAAAPTPAPAAAPATDYSAVTARLETMVRREMAEKGIPAISIALVDGPRTVWSRGFGQADSETVYRVGSVSKLFTDIAVMQLVERGELDLDAPVQRYLPDFAPRDPGGTPITLRHLMSHRAGLVREPPAGSYFHAEPTSLAATVASLNGTELVYRPGERSKYSNAGIATVGYVLERTQGEQFADYVARTVLQPLGMTRSSFVPRPDLQADLAKARMWTYHGTGFDAPTFELGMAPAGSMYSTVDDLGRFLSALFAEGQGENGRILRPETLREMWTPQFAPAGQETGFGIGFALSRLDGHRRIGHGGAIYGFATELAALPDRELGVVVAASKDIANAVTERIADEALRLMLAASSGAPLPPPVEIGPITAARAASLAGRWAGGGQTVELIARDDTLFVERGAMRARLGARGDTLVVDDVLAFGGRILPVGDRLVIGRDTLSRVPSRMPAAAPERWRPLIGEYGWDHNVLYIREKDGRLHALIEWFFDNPLEEVSPGVFRFPRGGLYDGESLVFERDASGRVTGVRAAGVLFPRRAVGTESGETFRIDPVRPVSELRAEALAARPPREAGEFREPDLVDLATLDPTLKFDVRYATTNNFMSAVFYDEPRAFLQRPAAEALVRAHQRLKPLGYGLLIHDAYRPWYVTKMFWDATPEESKVFVADPSQGSRHNRGAAVDLTLYDLRTGQPIEMVGGYDEFSDRSYPEYPGGTSLQRWHREVLRDAMEAEGFDVYPAEWWHFDYRDWRHYPIGNVTFDRIPGGGPMRAAVGAALLLLGGATTAVAQSGPLRGLDAYVEQAMRDWEIPGFALAIVRNDSVIHARGYGVREIGKPARVDEHTVFAVASTSKAFTAASLGMLVDEGKLEWDDRATEHLAGFQLFDPYVTRELTVRDLLSHRSGLARGDRLWWGSPFDRPEVLRRVRFLEPSTSFRSSYGYQNIMFLAAGEILPSLTGRSWDAFVRDRIFQPLGMRRSTTTVSALAGMENVATPHMTIDGKVVPIRWRSFDNLGGAGAINSSVRDMAQWMRLHLNEGEYEGRRLLSEEVVEEMQTPQTVIPSDTTTRRLYPDTHFRAYGLGWSLQDYRGEKMVSHGGALDGMKTQVSMIPELGIGVVTIANLDESNLQTAIAYRVIDALIGRTPPRDWSADLLEARAQARKRGEEREAKREQARVAGTAPSLPLPRYAGAYADSMYGEVRVEERGGKLYAHSGADFLGELDHWHFDTFRAKWNDPQAGRSWLTFRLNARGEVAALEVEGLGEFGRVPEPEPAAAGR